MNHYNLTTDEEELLNSVQSFAKQELPKLCHTAKKDKTAFPKNIFLELADLGLMGLSIEQRWGGIGATPKLQAAVCDTLSETNLGPAVFTSVHGMVSGLIEKFATEAQKESLLPNLATGKTLAAFALSEVNAGSDASNLSCSLTEQPSGSYLLNGAKAWITSAGAADIYLVFARLKGTTGKEGVTAVIVSNTLPGITFGSPEKKMGCELSPIATVSFENTPIATDSILGEIGKGMRIAYGGLTGGRINIAACANGLSRTALRKSIEHVRSRQAFGQTLGDFQGVQFKLAEMKTALDAAVLLVRDAAERHREDPKALSSRTTASEAKLFATETAMRITTDAVQLHGAMGYMQETGVEQLMRDAKMLQIVEGANEVQKSIIGQAVFELNL